MAETDAAPPVDTEPNWDSMTTAQLASEAGLDWREFLDDGLKTDASLASFKGVGELAKSYVETKKLVGQKHGLVAPGEKATPEERTAYDTALRQHLGVPATPAEYKITRPDVAQDGTWDEDAEKLFLAEMHRVGATTAQVQAALNIYGRIERAQLEAARAEANATGATLRKEWGPNYEAKLGRANRAIQEFGGDELIVFLGETGLGRHPLMVKAWAQVGDALVEHGAMSGEGLTGMAPDEAKEKIAKLREQLRKIPEGHPQAVELVDEIVGLTRVARGR